MLVIIVVVKQTSVKKRKRDAASARAVPRADRHPMRGRPEADSLSSEATCKASEQTGTQTEEKEDN